MSFVVENSRKYSLFLLSYLPYNGMSSTALIYHERKCLICFYVFPVHYSLCDRMEQRITLLSSLLLWQKPVSHDYNKDAYMQKKSPTECRNEVSMSSVADVIIMTKYCLALGSFVDAYIHVRKPVMDQVYL